MTAPRIAATWLAGGAGLVAVYFVLPRAGTAQSVLYVAIGLGGAAAILAGTARNRPERRWPWLFIAAAVLSFSAGDALSSIADSSPSVADAFYLAGYPLMAAGLVLLIAALPSAERVSSALDAAIVAVAFGLLQWVYLIEGAVNDPSWSTGEQVVSGVLYPTMDVLLLAALTAFFLGSSWRSRSFQLLGAGVLAMLVADEVVALSTSYSSGSGLDALLAALVRRLGGRGTASVDARALPAQPPAGPPSGVRAPAAPRCGAPHRARGHARAERPRRAAACHRRRDRRGAAGGARRRPIRADRPVGRAPARRAGRAERGAGASIAAQGRVRRAHLARPAHPSDVDPRVPRARHRSHERSAERRPAQLPRGRGAQRATVAGHHQRPTVRRAPAGGRARARPRGAGPRGDRRAVGSRGARASIGQAHRHPLRPAVLAPGARRGRQGPHVPARWTTCSPTRSSSRRRRAP